MSDSRKNRQTTVRFYFIIEKRKKSSRFIFKCLSTITSIRTVTLSSVIQWNSMEFFFSSVRSILFRRKLIVNFEKFIFPKRLVYFLFVKCITLSLLLGRFMDKEGMIILKQLFRFFIKSHHRRKKNHNGSNHRSVTSKK